MNPVIFLIHHEDEATSERKTQTSANSAGLALCSANLAVQVAPELIFMHEHCKYSVFIMNEDAILKEGQHI